MAWLQRIVPSFQTRHAPDDPRCVGCGYDLRGLASDSACPECGEAVVHGLGFDLTGADPVWLRRVLVGQTLMAIGLLLILVAPILLLGAPIVGVALAQAGMTNFDAVFGAIAGVAALGGIAGGLGLIVGVLFSTARDPRDSMTEKTWSRRNVTRVAVVIGVVACLVSVAGEWITMTGMSQVSTATALLAYYALFATALGILLIIGDLAHRARDHALVERAKQTYGGIRVTGLMLGVLVLLMSLPTLFGYGSELLDVLAACSGCMSFFVVIVALIQVAVLCSVFFQCRKMLRLVREVAIGRRERQASGADAGIEPPPIAGDES